MTTVVLDKMLRPSRYASWSVNVFLLFVVFPLQERVLDDQGFLWLRGLQKWEFISGFSFIVLVCSGCLVTITYVVRRLIIPFPTIGLLSLVFLLSDFQPLGPYANGPVSILGGLPVSVMVALTLEFVANRGFSARPLQVICVGMMLVGLIFFTPPEFSVERTSDIVISDSSNDKTSVIWIIADSLGNDMVFDKQGKVLGDLRTLSAFSKESTVYRRAVTSFTATEQAIPALFNGVVSGTPEGLNLKDKFGVFPNNKFAGARFYYSMAGPTPCGPPSSEESYFCDADGMGRRALFRKMDLLVHDLTAIALWNSYFPARNKVQTVQSRQIDYFSRLETVELDSRDLADFVENNGNQQFFAVYHTLETHVPWNKDRHGNVLWSDDDRVKTAGNFDTPSLRQLREQMRFESVVRFDRQLDGVLRAIRQTGQYENTIIIITSDHGSLFGSGPIDNHGRWSQNERDTLRLVANVPLFVKFPGQQEQVVVDEIVSTGQVANQLAVMFGVEIDRMKRPTLFDRRPTDSVVATAPNETILSTARHSPLQLLDFETLDPTMSLRGLIASGKRAEIGAVQVVVKNVTWFGAEANKPQLVSLQIDDSDQISRCSELQIFAHPDGESIGTVYRENPESNQKVATFIGLSEKQTDVPFVMCN